MMLSDLLRLPGMVLPVWGADHYLKTGWNPDETFEAVVNYLMSIASETEALTEVPA